VKLPPGEEKERIKRLEDGLRRAGVKMTHQRLEILRELARSSEHPDAETIYQGVRRRIPPLSLDTVYRTLWLLLDLGLISTLGASRDRARFDANLEPHHHFVCLRCGTTRDFYSREFDTLKIPDSVKVFGIPEKTQVEVRGVCVNCREKGKRV
jgi:Fur family peroxide stress response transcriptional regulator